MSKSSKNFKVPDQLANLYDFANTLDLRHFTHHGVPHERGDELAGPRELGAWMAQRGLLFTGARITPPMPEVLPMKRALPSVRPIWFVRFVPCTRNSQSFPTLATMPALSM